MRNSRAMSRREEVVLDVMMMMFTLYLTNTPGLTFHSASSLTQQFMGRHAASLGYIILIPSQPVFALTP